MKKLRFLQVHLDFHASPLIPEGKALDEFTCHAMVAID